MRPGLSQAIINFNFPKSDCISLIEAVSLFNQSLNKILISFSLSGVTSIVIFSVLNNTPMKVIIVEGGKALFLPLQFHISPKLIIML